MKTISVVLCIDLMLCAVLSGCKKKSEEERLEALYEKLNHAQGREVDAILEKIDKLRGDWFYFSVSMIAQDVVNRGHGFRKIAIFCPIADMQMLIGVCIIQLYTPAFGK